MNLRLIAFRLAGQPDTSGPFEVYGIVSAYLSGADQNENEFRHQLLQRELDTLGYHHSEFVGAWEGRREKAVAVKDVTPEVLEELGKKYKQDAVVYVAPGTRKLIRLRA